MPVCAQWLPTSAGGSCLSPTSPAAGGRERRTPAGSRHSALDAPVGSWYPRGRWERLALNALSEVRSVLVVAEWVSMREGAVG